MRFARRQRRSTPGSLPADVTAPAASASARFVVELLANVDERSFYIRGWAGALETLRTLVGVTASGERIEIPDSHRYRRDDVPGSGFAAYVDAGGPIGDPARLTFEAQGSGAARPRKVILDQLDARNVVLGELGTEPPNRHELLARHVHPAVQRLQERQAADTRVTDVRQRGTAPGSADVSVVVPLYQRIELVEEQLAAFARDPTLRGIDLIYVLDSPELGDKLTELGDRLAATYDVPFRTAVMNRNVGYSAANNAGAALARGRLLLLLNSDVVPRQQGWLHALTTFYDATDKIGALGARLLYPDGRIQHAGMFFAREPSTGLWSNEHYFKERDGETHGADVTRRVPAVTGAALLIARELYEGVGGLDGRYVQGDFEDSHLCLQLTANGLDTWYFGDVSLTHPEGQSYPDALRRLTWRYNAWLHTSVWDAQIEELMNSPIAGWSA